MDSVILESKTRFKLNLFKLDLNEFEFELDLHKSETS